MTDEDDPPKPRRHIRASNIVAKLTSVGFPFAIAGLLPARHWIVDLPACFPVQGGALLLVGAIGLAIARRWWLGAIWGLGAVAALVVIAPGQIRCAAERLSADEGAPSAGRLTAMALNLQRGAHRHADRAVRLLETDTPDLLFVSELTPGWHRGMATVLGRYPHRHEQVDPGYYGLALYSRYPITATTVPLGVDWAPAMRATVRTPWGEVGLLGIHPPRPGRRHRNGNRDAALAAIPDRLEGLPARRLVLGDFNATPWNGAFSDLLGATELRHGNGLGFAPSWPTSLPWPFRVPIDHVLVGGPLVVEEVAIGDSFGSDHAPLFVRVRL